MNTGKEIILTFSTVYLTMALIALGVWFYIVYTGDQTTLQATVSQDQKSYLALESQMDGGQISAFTFYQCVTNAEGQPGLSAIAYAVEQCPAPDITGQ